MKYKTGYIAKRVGVSPPTVRLWADEYGKYLSDMARKRAPGAPRRFTAADADIMATIAAARDKGLTHPQIVSLIEQGKLETLPDMPTDEEQEARESVQLIPAAEKDMALSERDRALDILRVKEADIERITGERDNAIEQWQTDVTSLQSRIAQLTGELGRARGMLVSGVALVIVLAIVAVALGIALATRGG